MEDNKYQDTGFPGNRSDNGLTNEQSKITKGKKLIPSKTKFGQNTLNNDRREETDNEIE